MRLLRSALILLAACGPKGPEPAPLQSDDADFPKKGPPKPGEWLARFHEPGQTLRQYLDGHVNQKSEARAVIYIRPMGDVMARHPGVIEAMREYAELFYQTEAKLLDPAAMPEEALDKGRGQFNGDRLLTILANDRPAKTLMYVGLTADDLYSEGLNFVFGVGSIEQRVGVYSLHRYGGDGDLKFLERALKVMSHEMGHILSIQHCIEYECVMNGSNSLGETDAQPMHLCPTDLRKVVWNVACDARKRYDALESYYRKRGFEAEAAFTAKVKAKLR